MHKIKPGQEDKYWPNFQPADYEEWMGKMLRAYMDCQSTMVMSDTYKELIVDGYQKGYLDVVFDYTVSDD